ncbi:MAG: PAS domain-containing protein, partial [Planctomycetales bacterium]
MSKKPKILLVDDAAELNAELYQDLTDRNDVVHVHSYLRALAHLRHGQFDGVYVSSNRLDDLVQLGRLVQNDLILEGMPDGVVLLDLQNRIIWHNECMEQWCDKEEVLGEDFYGVLSSPEILGPDYCPFHSAVSSGVASTSTLRTADNRYFQIHAAPVFEGEKKPHHLIVSVRDVTQQMLQQQKLEAIHKAGMALADLKPDELMHMSVDERIELLKADIIHFTGELLNYDVIEIRLVDEKSGKLATLLAMGMAPEAQDRELFVQPLHNGVTGFVAATGKSYLCDDTTEDPLYISGAKDAKSSLTVPLILHDKVIGTFNVESPESSAFTE